MKILVACEESGIVRDAFRRRGHDAMSCDLLPTARPGKHYQGDVMDIIGDGFDLMIAHPPCRYLSSVGNRHWNQPGRYEKRQEAFKFFIDLYYSDIPKKCLENPVGYVNTALRKPDQIIHPYYFGEREMKRTCLWLVGLPVLEHFAIDDLFGNRTHTEHPQPKYTSPSGKKNYFHNAAPGDGELRQRYRSRTFLSIAEAMATQWG